MVPPESFNFTCGNDDDNWSLSGSYQSCSNNSYISFSQTVVLEYQYPILILENTTFEPSVGFNYGSNNDGYIEIEIYNSSTMSGWETIHTIQYGGDNNPTLNLTDYADIGDIINLKMTINPDNSYTTTIYSGTEIKNFMTTNNIKAAHFDEALYLNDSDAEISNCMWTKNEVNTLIYNRAELEYPQDLILRNITTDDNSLGDIFSSSDNSIIVFT